MTEAATKTWTAAELVSRLQEKYSSGGYIVLEQVANGTGFKCTSWIDAVVVGLWPSLGLHRFAFEIKVSRDDFLAEKRKRGKNMWARKYMHEFWFIAPEGAIKESDLLEGDGLMVPKGDDLLIIRPATHHEAKCDDALIASFARSIHKKKKQLKRALYDELERLL